MFEEVRALYRFNRSVAIATGYMIILSVWWLSMCFRHITSGPESDVFTSIYGFLALFGGIFGLRIAHDWGGFKSVFGRALSFISLGLLAQFFGQVCYFIYIYGLGVEVPYPSIGDAGFFGSVVFYIIGTFSLFRVVGSHLRYSSFRQLAISIVLPLILLGWSYFVFLKDYDFSTSGGLGMMLDFGYPLGQTIYVSLAILVAFLSRSTLGGMMRMPMLCLLYALVFQYFCDFTFLYQVQHGTWYVGGINDYMYFASYFFMTISLGFIGTKLRALRSA